MRDGRDGSPTACIELSGSRAAKQRAAQITAALDRAGVHRLDDLTMTGHDATISEAAGWK